MTSFFDIELFTSVQRSEGVSVEDLSDRAPPGLKDKANISRLSDRCTEPYTIIM